MEHLIIDAATLDLEEQVVSINRVAKVVKGGRNFRFSALVVVGDRQGHVGVGMSKALEVPEAIRKAVQDAKKHLIEVSIVDTTIPHEIKGVYGAGKVIASAPNVAENVAKGFTKGISLGADFLKQAGNKVAEAGAKTKSKSANAKPGTENTLQIKKK